MNNAQLINQTSGAVEYYTDPAIVEAAREVMGGIDLDPASSEHANLFHVGALNFYTEADDGLSRQWFGRVWMNHPFHRGERACPKDRSRCKKKICKTRGHIDADIPSNADWINKLVGEYIAGRVVQACAITFVNSSEGWFRPLLDFPICFLTPRTAYYTPQGEKADDVPKGSCVTYLGPNVSKFKSVFEGRGLGAVKV